ncbi:MAG: hypothetical protein ACOY90_19760 [Candidatus Zhuqueibacterota bacterium]
MKTSKIFISIIIFSVVNCTPMIYKVLPLIENNLNSEILFFEGNELIISTGEDSDLLIYGIHKGEDLIFHIFIKNKSNEKINLFPERFHVKGMDKRQKKYDLHVYDPDLFLAKLRNEHAFSMFLSALASGIDAYNSAKTTSSTHFYLNNGTAGHVTSETYDNSKRSQIMNENIDRLKETDNQFEQNLGYISQRLLKRNTLYPGQSLEGNIIIGLDIHDRYNTTNTHKVKYIDLTVPFGKDEHRFKFLIAKLGDKLLEERYIENYREHQIKQNNLLRIRSIKNNYLLIYKPESLDLKIDQEFGLVRFTDPKQPEIGLFSIGSATVVKVIHEKVILKYDLLNHINELTQDDFIQFTNN